MAATEAAAENLDVSPLIGVLDQGTAVLRPFASTIKDLRIAPHVDVKPREGRPWDCPIRRRGHRLQARHDGLGIV
jgi:hypothetical protein